MQFTASITLYLELICHLRSIFDYLSRARTTLRSPRVENPIRQIFHPDPRPTSGQILSFDTFLISAIDRSHSSVLVLRTDTDDVHVGRHLRDSWTESGPALLHAERRPGGREATTSLSRHDGAQIYGAPQPGRRRRRAAEHHWQTRSRKLELSRGIKYARVFWWLWRNLVMVIMTIHGIFPITGFSFGQ